MRLIYYLTILFSFSSIFSMEKRQLTEKERLEAMLSMAVSNGDTFLIKESINQGADVHSPFLFAVSTGNDSLVFFLYAKGANPNEVLKDGISIVQYLSSDLCSLDSGSRALYTHFLKASSHTIR